MFGRSAWVWFNPFVWGVEGDGMRFARNGTAVEAVATKDEDSDGGE